MSGGGGGGGAVGAEGAGDSDGSDGRGGSDGGGAHHALVRALAAAVGAEHVTLDGAAAPGAADAGRGTVDGAGSGDGARVVTVRPAAAADVSRVLRALVGATPGTRLAVSGGDGPGRVGGAGDGRGSDGALVVRLDTARLASVLHLDETSLLVHVQAGLSLGALAGQLAARGLSLGALPAATLARTVGAALAAPRPSEGTPRGRLVDACVAVEGVLADGAVVTTRVAPRKATGPELASVLIGARGRTGVLTSAWLRVERVAPARRLLAFGFAGSDGRAAIDVARRLLDRGVRPADLAVVRPALADDALDGAAVILCLLLDGVPELVEAGAAIAVTLAAAAGARALPDEIAGRHLASSAPRPDGERFVPLAALAATFASDGSARRITALSPAGAALLGDAPSPPVVPASASTTVPAGDDGIAAIQRALLHALDPHALLSPTGRGW